MNNETTLGVLTGLAFGALLGLGVIAAFLFMIAFSFLHFISNMLSVLRDIHLQLAGLGHVGNAVVNKLNVIHLETQMIRAAVVKDDRDEDDEETEGDQS